MNFSSVNNNENLKTIKWPCLNNYKTEMTKQIFNFQDVSYNPIS